MAEKYVLESELENKNVEFFLLSFLHLIFLDRN